MSAIGVAPVEAVALAVTPAALPSLKALGKRRETERKPRALNRLKVVEKDMEERVTRSRSTLDVDGASEGRSGEEGD